MQWGERTWHEVFGQQHSLDRLTVGSVDFDVSNIAVRPSTPRHFSLMKDKAMVLRYVELIERFDARRVVELGIFQGGSAAFIALLPGVEQLVAFELKHRPIDAVLDAFATEHDLTDRFHMRFGVDQADGAAMNADLDRLGMHEIDLLTDDASHMYEPTVASFEALFPRIRVGGAYIIEDWRSALVDIDLGPGYERRGNVPLVTLAFQLVMAAGAAPEIIASVDVSASMIVVTRGDAEIDPDSFSLAAMYNDDAARLIGDWRR